MNPSDRTPDAARKAMPEARLPEPCARLEEIKQNLVADPTLDRKDMATAREGDEVPKATGRAGRQETAMSRAALGRIAAGIATGCYGPRARCGVPIAAARLDLLSAPPLFRRCAI